jgi:hypothetical protein
MPKKFVLFLLIFIMCWATAPTHQTCQPSDIWLFNPDAVMNFGFAKNADVIVVARLKSERLPRGVELYSNNPPHISGVKLLDLQVEQVIKGSAISAGTELQVLILPWVTVLVRPYWEQPSPRSYENEMNWDPRKAFEELRKTGHLPADAPPQKEIYPEIAVGQEGIFGLFPASFEDPTGSMMWLGAEKLNQGKPLFGYSAFFSMDVNHQEVKVLQRYLEIGAIQDRQEQFRELAHFSLRLLKDPQTPQVIAIAAAADATAAFPDARSLLNVSASLLEKQRLQQSRDHLDDQGLNELVQIAANPSRPFLVRDKLMWAILQLVDLGRSIDLQPLLRVIEDSKDNPDIRSQVVRTLGDLANPEVRKKFEEILSKPPADHADKYVQDEIRKSKIMKQPQNK